MIDGSEVAASGRRRSRRVRFPAAFAGRPTAPVLIHFSARSRKPCIIGRLTLCVAVFTASVISQCRTFRRSECPATSWSRRDGSAGPGEACLTGPSLLAPSRGRVNLRPFVNKLKPYKFPAIDGLRVSGTRSKRFATVSGFLIRWTWRNRLRKTKPCTFRRFATCDVVARPLALSVV